MDREFLQHYDRELRVLRQQVQEFAEEYPGIADRLGGLVAERMDPMIAGLLEGAAFLAARVQLKLAHEFPEFTSNLLEQLVPDFLAPQPSAMVVRVLPPYGDPALMSGRRIAAGSYLDATYVERDRQVACRYQLGADVTLWPFELVRADYLADTASLAALRLPVDETSRAGLRLSFTTRMAAKPEAEISDQDALKEKPFQAASCRAEALKLHLVVQESDAIALYEQIFGQRTALYVRHLDAFGDPVCLSGAIGAVAQIGLDGRDSLVPRDARIFDGFALLKDYFLFERKFLGFSIGDLGRLLRRTPAKSFDVILTFSESNPRLTSAVTREAFALYAAPAANLFAKTTDRIAVSTERHEHHVVADRSRPLDFEPHKILEVFAHRPGSREKIPVPPLYSASREPGAGSDGLYYTVRRMPRRRNARERQYGQASNYTGTEMFLSLVDGAGIDEEHDVAELSLRALCSNRHLTEQLPVGAGGADFRLVDDTSLDLMCVAGPTPPREPVVGHLRTRGETAFTGSVSWRLINMLGLNHLGLLGRGAGRNAQSLREILTLFANLGDVAVERRINGIRGLDSRPIVRRVRRATGVGAARGLEITVTFDERAFEGSGIFALGAVLDRFFAEYVAVNNFTQTVIVSQERGEVMRGPVRLGARGTL